MCLGILGSMDTVVKMCPALVGTHESLPNSAQFSFGNESSLIVYGPVKGVVPGSYYPLHKLKKPDPSFLGTHVAKRGSLLGLQNKQVKP